jgi:hypothetical protein
MMWGGKGREGEGGSWSNKPDYYLILLALEFSPMVALRVFLSCESVIRTMTRQSSALRFSANTKSASFGQTPRY